MERNCLPTAFVLAVVLAWCAPAASASCTGASPTWTAASAAREHVLNCIAAASPGDTIHVPAGTQTWSSAVWITKSVSVIGAGIGKTNITASGDCFAINLANTIRVSGFSFTDCTIRGSVNVVSGATFRIDHNSFTSNSWKQNSFDGYCQTPQLHPTGLIDNNTLHNYRTLIQGTLCMLGEGNQQHQLWAQQPPKGGGVGIVYLEDNQITNSAGNAVNWIDGNYGARYVARYNTITNSNGATTYAEVHSVQALNRAVQWWEFYGNTLSGSSGGFGFGFIRGGSGFIWGNRVPSGTSSFRLNNLRSNTACTSDGTCRMGPCNGGTAWDGNTAGLNGYPCRDQIGRSYDTTLWNHNTMPAYSQPLTPAYFWDNTAGGSTLYNPALHEGLSGTSYQGVHIAANRDYYTQTNSFNGSTGVGVGPISSRPSACTVGVGYWATDQGEWNSKNAGPDGQLYRCTAPNTWSLEYVPFSYPHPLRGAGGGATRPAPPTNLSVTVQ